MDLKEFQLHTVYAVILDTTFTTCWSGGRVQVWDQVWAPACHLAISLKAIPGGNSRFGGQKQRPSSWGSFPALLVQVGQASTNMGCFLVRGSCCWPQQACLRTNCSSKVNKVLMLCKFWAVTSHFFFMWNKNLDGICGKLLLTKAGPVALLNLSISHWSLSKNMT